MTPAEREVLEEFSGRMWALIREGDDEAVRTRYGTLHTNAQLMLKGQDTPQLRAQFKKNLDDLRRYEEGFYDELAKVLG